MGAEYSIELISIQTYATQFIGHNKIFLGSAVCRVKNLSGVSCAAWNVFPLNLLLAINSKTFQDLIYVRNL